MNQSPGEQAHWGLIPGPEEEESPVARIKVGDLVLVHGIVGVVLELVPGLGFIYQVDFGEPVAYNAKWPIEPEPKRIWICEQ